MKKYIKIAILDDYQRIALSVANWSELEGKADITVFSDHLVDPGELIQRLLPFDVLCVMRERTPLTQQILSALPQLKLIVSTGYSNPSIDLEAAAGAGIRIKNTGYHSSGAPELTWALLMAIARKIPQENRNIRSGYWQTTVGTDLNGKTIGIVGLGSIGRKIAAYAKVFNMKVLAWSPNLTDEKAEAIGVSYVSKEALFRNSDFITIHMVLSEETVGLIDWQDFRLMKSSAYLINTSRGPLINERDLIKALEQETMAGAALDVFDQEPLSTDHPFRVLPNVLATPHIGYGTEDTYKVFYKDTVNAISEWLAYYQA